MHISSFSHSVLLVFRTEEKLVAILAFNSFRRVTTNMLRRILVFTSGGKEVRQAVLR